MNKRIYTNQKIEFGKSFIIRGAQFENIDNEYSGMTEISIRDKQIGDTGKMVTSEKQFMVTTEKEWNTLKRELSDALIEQVMNYRATQEWGSEMTPLKDIVSLTIEYTGSGKESVLNVSI